jgi:hypothetical protein
MNKRLSVALGSVLVDVLSVVGCASGSEDGQANNGESSGQSANGGGQGGSPRHRRERLPNP